MRRRVRRERRSRLEITLAGKVILTFLAIAFCVAFLYDSNPVLFVVCCLLATVLLSAALTWFAVPPLELSRSLPERIFLGEAFDVRLRITNRSRWRPALGIGFKDTLQISRPGSFVCGATLPVLPPRGHAEVLYTKRLHRRGVYAISSCVVTTRFPFALFERRLLLRSAEARLAVLPPLGRLRAGRRQLVERLSHPREVRHAVAGREQFHSLREYRAGDSLRLVHWPTTARVGKLIRRVMQDESGEDLHVLLDTYVGEGLHGETRARHLEKAVSCAATLLMAAAKRGRRATVVFPEGRARHYGTLQGVVPALEALAGLTASRVPADQFVAQLSSPRMSRMLLLSLQGPALAARRAAAERGLGLEVWDVSSPGFERIFSRR